MKNEVEVDLLLETGGGGSGRHVLDLYAGLKSSGWNPHLVLSRYRADQGFLSEVSRIPQRDVTFLDMRRSPHITDLRAISQLRSYLANSGRHHLLHAHSTKAGILGGGMGELVLGKILTPHAYRGMDPTLKWHKAGAIRLAERAFSRPYSKIIAVSPDEEAYLISSLQVPEDRICCIPNGVDPASIRQRINSSSAGGGSRRQPVIGFVGRLVHQKAPELFLEAFRAVVERGVEVRALIVGEGPLRASLAKSAADYNLSHLMDWRGEVPGVEELAGMDVVVHTSRYESFPYTLLEAAAAGTPIVSVENSGSRAILGHELPEAIVASAEPAKLADAILDVLQDGPARSRHLAMLEGVSRRFTIENMVKATIAVYEDVLKTVPTPPRSRSKRDGRDDIQ